MLLKRRGLRCSLDTTWHHKSTAYNIVKRGLDNNGILSKKRGGARKEKVDQRMKDQIVEIVEEHPEYTLDQINADLQLQMPDAPHVSRSTIARTLENQLIVTKCLHDVPAQRNTDGTKAGRYVYANWLLQNGATTNFIFVDEAGK